MSEFGEKNMARAMESGDGSGEYVSVSGISVPAHEELSALQNSRSADITWGETAREEKTEDANSGITRRGALGVIAGAFAIGGGATASTEATAQTIPVLQIEETTAQVWNLYYAFFKKTEGGDLTVPSKLRAAIEKIKTLGTAVQSPMASSVFSGTESPLSDLITSGQYDRLFTKGKPQNATLEIILRREGNRMMVTLTTRDTSGITGYAKASTATISDIPLTIN